MKFWGKKIKDDTRRPRRSPIIQVDPTNDIGPECHVLDLGIGFKDSKLWVRQDYIRIYDYCERRHEEGPSSASAKARSVVITGQPGVGKTCWVSYAVRRRLGEKKPFLWYLGRVCYLFVKNGVFRQSVKNVSAEEFAPFLWAFVDAGECRTGVPEKLIDSTNLYIMFTTSPTPERWSTLSKYTKAAVIIMNTWSLEEIRLAAKIQGLTDEQQVLAEDYFTKVGPIPRMCIDFAEDPNLLVRYEKHCEAMVEGLTSDSLRHFVLHAGFLDLDAESHWHPIFIIRRSEVDDLEGAYLEPISADAERKIMATIHGLQSLERVKLYYRFASVKAARAVAGLVYKSLGHTRVQEGITLIIKPMIKSRKQTFFHWNSPVEEQASDSTDQASNGSNSMDQDDSVTSVSFPPKTEIIYKGILRSVKPNRLYVPEVRNQGTFDSFFILDHFLYIFQFTMTENHSIKKGIEESLSVRPNKLPPKTNWRFVFVTPPDCEVDVKATSEVEQSLEGVTLYSAHLEIER